MYDTYLVQLGVQPVAVVGRLVQTQEIDSTKEETIHKRYKNTKYTSQKTKTTIKRILKYISQAI